MLLYPILCPKQWSTLKRRGRLIGLWRAVDSYHVEPYRWMVAAMRRRGIDTRSRPPVWAWHTFHSRARPKPDLRSSYYLTTPGTRAVRLTIEVPDELVLLSDYEDWHAVLNRHYLSNTEREDRAIERKYPQVPRRLLESSWERIFDLGSGSPDWRGKPAERSIQACLPFIESAWVREATPFTARGTRRK